MSYVKGDGSQTNPWVIADAATFKYWLTTDAGTAGKYAVIANDITFSSLSATGTFKTVIGSLDGNGKKFIGYKSPMGMTVGSGGVVKKINFVSPTGDVSNPWLLTRDGSGVLSDISIIGGATNCSVINISPAAQNFIRLVIDTGGELYSIYSGVTMSGCYLLRGGIGGGAAGYIDLRSTPDKYNPLNYPAFPADLWMIDGVSQPKQKDQDTLNLFNVFAVKGTTKVAGVGKKRHVRAHAPYDFKTVIDGYSDQSSGSYFLNLGDYKDTVYLTHSDDYGLAVQPSTSYALDAIIHPATPNGYRYKCTTPGSTGASTPAEPWPTSTSLTAGTAIFTPEPVYKTETFLVQPRLYNLSTGQPV